jgi:hypothetical protein
MWKANGKTTTLQLFLDSLSPKLWKRLWTCRKTDQYLNLKVKLSLCLINWASCHEDVWGVEVYIHVFLTSAAGGGEWSASFSGRFSPGESAPGIHWIGGSVGPRTGLDDVERRKILPLPGFELRSLGRPARSQSPYWQSYPGRIRCVIYIFAVGNGTERVISMAVIVFCSHLTKSHS